MLTEYIDEALRRAPYEVIDDAEAPYWGEIAALPGVWANAPSLELCRERVKDTIEGWLLLSVKRGLPIPRLGEFAITEVTVTELSEAA